MSRTIRFGAALLILASLTCGSLGASSRGSRIPPIEHGRGDFLNAIVEWIASVYARERPSGDAPKPSSPQTKDTSSLDPHGGH
jgi:hypothetical protein